MRIEKTYTDFHITDDIEELVEKKIRSVERLLKRFEKDTEITIFVELARSTKHHRKGNVFYAEATFTLGDKTIRAEATNPDMRAAIDEVKEKLKNEIRRFKDKNLAMRRKR